MTGSIKIKPLVIGKFLKPRCFKNFNLEKFVDYRKSTKSWMTTDIFNNWLLQWDMTLDKCRVKNYLL